MENLENTMVVETVSDVVSDAISEAPVKALQINNLEAVGCGVALIAVGYGIARLVDRVKGARKTNDASTEEVNKQGLFKKIFAKKGSGAETATVKTEEET